jgi:hypothetical protein
MNNFTNDFTPDGFNIPSDDAQSHNRHVYLQGQEDFRNGTDPEEFTTGVEQRHYNSGWAYAEWEDSNV